MTTKKTRLHRRPARQPRGCCSPPAPAAARSQGRRRAGRSSPGRAPGGPGCSPRATSPAARPAGQARDGRRARPGPGAGRAAGRRRAGPDPASGTPARRATAGTSWLDQAPGRPRYNGPPGAQAFRGLALLNVAIYDATVAAWDTKYAYNRPRPAELDPSLATAIPTPASPPTPPSTPSRPARRRRAGLPIAGRGRSSPRRRRRPPARACWPGPLPQRRAAGLELGRAGGRPGDRARQGRRLRRRLDRHVPTGPGMWTGEALRAAGRHLAALGAGLGRPVPPRTAPGPRLAERAADWTE